MSEMQFSAAEMRATVEALSAEIGRLTWDMYLRELHHFETEQQLADVRGATLREAYAACERQTQLASLVAGRPSDFEKGVMSCMTAIQALTTEQQ